MKYVEFSFVIKRILINPQCLLHVFCISITVVKSILYFGLLVQNNWQSWTKANFVKANWQK